MRVRSLFLLPIHDFRDGFWRTDQNVYMFYQLLSFLANYCLFVLLVHLVLSGKLLFVLLFEHSTTLMKQEDTCHVY